MKKPALPAAVLLLFLFGGLLAGGWRDPVLWTVASALLWGVGLAWPAAEERVPGLKWWVGWLVWLALSGAAGDQPLKSLYALSHWVTLAAFFALALTHWRAAESGLWLKGLCATGPVLALGSLFFSHESFPMTGFMPPYYNYTMFALAAACAAGSVAATQAAGHGRLVFSGAAAVCLAVIVAARSRGALLAVMAAWALSLARRGMWKTLMGMTLALAAALGCFAAPLAGHFMKPEIIGSMKRPQIWRAALQVAGEHPILGEGPGNFEQGFLRHNFPSGLSVRYGFGTDRAHSELLGFAAETGWIGLAIFLAALAACLRGVRRASAPAGEASLAAFAAMSVQCLVDNMLHIPALGMLFLSSLACAHGAVGVQPAAGARDHRRRWRVFCVLGLFLSLLSWIPGKVATSSRDDYWSHNDPARRLALAERVVRLFPGDAYFRELLAKASLGLNPPDWARGAVELMTAGRLNPTNALYPAWRASIMLAQGDFVEAESIAGKALELEPYCHQARLVRAEAMVRLGRRREALAELDEIDRRVKAVSDLREYSGYSKAILSLDRGRFDRLSRTIRNGN